MDDVIARQLRGEATAQEIADLVRWRVASPENERHYREAVRLLTALRTAAAADPLTPPRATDLLARMASRTHDPRAGLPQARRAARWWVVLSIGIAPCLLIVAHFG